MKKKLSLVCMGFGTVFLVAAVALLIYNRYDDRRAGKRIDEIQRAFEVIMVDISVKTAEDEQHEAESETDEGYVMNTVEMDGENYIETLTIPELALKLPIMADWSYPKLKDAPCRYIGSVWTDDLVICGHNYTRHFGYLKYLEAGNLVTFTDVDGNVFYYEVSEVIILQPTDGDELLSHESGDWDLTLFTCTIGGQARVTVRCVCI